MKLRIIIYNATHNLGDAIQTQALCRLLNQECDGVYRDLPYPEPQHDSVLIVYGWCGWRVPERVQRCVISGIHLGANVESYINWMRLQRQPIGVRDPYTHWLLKANGLESTIVGCATLTLPRYNGPRSGRFSVDLKPRPGTEVLTNTIGNLCWSEQWRLAAQRLNQLRTAAVVYTSRLHVVLPCLAFGTPVVFPRAVYEEVAGRERLTLLEQLGFEYDVAVQMDVDAWADRYRHFLADGLHSSLSPTAQPRMPIPLPYGDLSQILRGLTRNESSRLEY